jgi:hypothetical protein
LLISQKGSQRLISPDRIEYGLWDKMSLNYIEVPVMLSYNFNPKIQAQIGIGWAYLFGKHLTDYSGPWKKEDINFLRKNEVSTFYSGVYNFAPRFSAFARYTRSIIPINTGSNTIAYWRYYTGMINSVASFGIYYHFQDQKLK